MQEANAARAHALYVAGALAISQSDNVEATRMLTECLAIRRSLGNPRETAATLTTLATLHLQQDDAIKAHEYDSEALGIFRELGDRAGEGIGLLNLGEISVRQADYRAAGELFEQGLVIARSIEHHELESDCERNLGELSLHAGNLPAARERFTRALQICRGAEDKRSGAIAVWWLGRVDFAAGDRESARSKFAETLAAFKALDMNAEALDCLEDYAELLCVDGAAADAVRLYSAAAAIREVLALKSPRGEASRKQNVETARRELGVSAFDAAWAAGRKCKLDEAIACALAAVSPVPVAA